MDIFIEETSTEEGSSTFAMRAMYDRGQRAFKVRTHEVGAGLEATEGVRERESGIRLTEEELAAVWPYLIRELAKSLGDGTVDRMRHLCELAKVDPHFWTSQSKTGDPQR